LPQSPNTRAFAGFSDPESWLGRFERLTLRCYRNVRFWQRAVERECPHSRRISDHPRTLESALMDGRPNTSRNVLGDRLEICSINPMTGFFREGCCDTGREDIGSHTVCAVMTATFLEFSKSRGNDLSTPMPEFGVPA
jgi:hypothetical protein